MYAFTFYTGGRKYTTHPSQLYKYHITVTLGPVAYIDDENKLEVKAAASTNPKT